MRRDLLKYFPALITLFYALTVSMIALWPGSASIMPPNQSSATRTPTQSTQPSAHAESKAIDMMASMSLRDKITSLLILHLQNQNISSWNSFVTHYRPGGLILMGDNVPLSEDGIHQLINEVTQPFASAPLLFAIDEEGCDVKRLAADTFPCARELANKSPEEVTSAFSQRSRMLNNYGINLNFGVVADVTADRQSFIYPRVFGSDPASAAARVAAAVLGSSHDSLITIKHFPGHGETPANSHSTIPQIGIGLEQWRMVDAIPFQAGIDAGADMVMFGHLAYTSVDSAPASLSRRWHDILAVDMRFDGVSITDDLIMLQQSGDPAYADPVSNAVRALNAGNTMLLFVNDHGTAESRINIARLIDGLVAATQRGDVDEKMIDKNVVKVLQLRIKAAALAKK